MKTAARFLVALFAGLSALAVEAASSQSLFTWFYINPDGTYVEILDGRITPEDGGEIREGSPNESVDFVAHPPLNSGLRVQHWIMATKMPSEDVEGRDSSEVKILASYSDTLSVSWNKNHYFGTDDVYVGVRFYYITNSVVFNRGASDATGSTASIFNQCYTNSYALTPNGFSRPGYTFASWTNNVGSVYANKAKVSGSSLGVTNNMQTVNLYAVWTAKTSALTFNANGGTGTMTTGKVATYGQAMPTGITLPTRTGYTFAGFYDATSGGTKYYNANGSSAQTWNKDTISGTTLYAQWTANKYEYRFTSFSFYAWARSSSAALQQSSSSGGSLSFDRDAGTVSVTSGSTVPVNSEYSRSVETYSSSYKVSISEAAATGGWQFTFYCKLSGTSTSCCVDWVEYDANGEIILNGISKLRNLGNVSASVGTYVKTFTVSSNCRAVQFVFVNRTANSSATFSDIGLSTSSDYGYGAPTPLRKILTYSETQKVGNLPTGVSRTGYAFDWVCWVNGAPVTVTSDTTMASLGAGDKFFYFGNWTAKTYMVTFDRQSGSGGSSSVTATYNSAMPAATMPTRTGYVFGGYYTGTGGGGAQYYTSAGASARNWNIANNTTLYAQWTAKTSALTFNANGGTGTMTTGKVATYGAAMPTGITLPTKTGYTFTGFYDATSGGTTYYNADGTSARTWDKDATSGTTLYAQWAAKTTAVHFWNYGANTGISDKNFTYGEELKDITKPSWNNGYRVFLGYYTQPGGQGSRYWDADGMPDSSRSTWDVDADEFNIYAYYVDNDCHITYKANGGSGADVTVLFTNAVPIVLSDGSSFSRHGCELLGWDENPSVGEPNYSLGQQATFYTSVGKTEIILNAIWKEYYYVAFDGNGATNETPMAIQKFAFGESKALNANEYGKVGYSFFGWSTNEVAAMSNVIAHVDCDVVKDIEKSVGGTNTLFASWRPISYVTAFDASKHSSVAIAPSNCIYDVEFSLPTVPYNDGDLWQFVGWSNTLENVVYYTNEVTVVSNLCTTAGATNTLVAVWESMVGELSEAMDIDNLVWANTGDGSWHVVDGGYETPTCVAQEVLPSSSKLWVMTSSVTNSGTLSFWWKTSAGSASLVYYSYQNASTTTEKLSASMAWTNVVLRLEISPLYAPTRTILLYPDKSGVADVVYVDRMTWTPDGSSVEPTEEDARDISGISFDGGVLSLSFANADERFSYNLRGTNDLVAPLALWPVLWTTNGTGNITITPPLVPSAPQFFYYLETTAK